MMSPTTPTTPTTAPAAHRVLAAGLALSLSAAAALATPVLITEPTTIGPLDTEIMAPDGTIVPLAEAEITVSGTTLTINGRHDIMSLVIGTGSVVTHDANFVFDYSMGAGTDVVNGFDLAVAGDVVVDGSMSVTGRGFPGDQGPGAGSLDQSAGGGGGHGGEGGNSNTGAAGGITYGSVLQPVEFGSGGGTDIGGVEMGREGGGAIRLIVGGTLTVNGDISANGIGDDDDNRESGGGAGGSIWITTASLQGTTGLIRATGGDGEVRDSVQSGAGAGGRVAIYTDGAISPFLRDRITALGNDGWSSGITGGDGAAGTVYIEEAGRGELIVDNNGRSGRVTVLSDDDIIPRPFVGDLTVRALGRVGPAPLTRLDLEVTGNMTVAITARVDANGRGFPGDEGPGAGELNQSAGGGGGHGGEGGNSNTGASGGIAYGSALQPTTFGSGGGTDIGGVETGRHGGGAIKLSVGGTLTLDGTISADGFGDDDDNLESGGGAGGSIWIDAGQLAGVSGEIRATGGDGEVRDSVQSGAGAGGRVAVYVNDPIPAFLIDRITALGNDGWSSGITGGDGAAGTVYIEEAGVGTLIVDNNGRSGRVTVLSDTDILPKPYDGNMIIREVGRVGPAPMTLLDLELTGDLDLQLNGVIDASGRGFPGDEGPGAGERNQSAGGGGGHGGLGGNSNTGGAGGASYGSIYEPTTFGSGGGTDIGGSETGRHGGGALKLVVGGTLTIDGTIAANGFGDDDDNLESGGGAGGSVWIDAAAVEGVSGQVSTSGGDGEVRDSVQSGAGAGGRVAIYSGTPLPDFLRARITARGNDGWSSGLNGGDGAAGTVYLVEDGVATLIVDNGGRNGRLTPFGSQNPEVDPDGRLAIAGSMLVTGEAYAGPEQGEFLHLDVQDDVEVTGTGTITTTFQGFASDEGPGAGMAGRTWGGGAGHAAAGGDGRSDDPDALGGEPYGIDTFPVTLGSGGGSDPDAPRRGGRGAGALRLSVGGNLDLVGPITASGESAGGNEAGGGSGGSLWIEAGSITGVSSISANGGNGSSAGGGGSGGYVAVYSCDISPSISFSANGGTTGSGSRGGDGTVLVGSTSVEITSQPPMEQTLAPGSTLELSVSATGVGPLTYQWRFDGQPLIDDGRVSGSTTTDLRITSITEDDAGRYDVLVSDICGPFPSRSSFLIIDGTCRADFDGDGELTIFDFLGFSNAFDAGDLRADFDGDGSLTIFDFLAFSNEFDAGCP
ncbi:MAG: immunoglobulin domain-containing protein [Phycisphaerales bacterium]